MQLREPKSIGELVIETYRLSFAHLWTLVRIGLIAGVPLMIVGLAIMAGLMYVQSLNLDFDGFWIVGLALYILLVLPLWQLAGMAMMVAAARASESDWISWTEPYQVARARIGVAFPAYLIVLSCAFVVSFGVEVATRLIATMLMPLSASLAAMVQQLGSILGFIFPTLVYAAFILAFGVIVFERLPVRASLLRALDGGRWNAIRYALGSIPVMLGPTIAGYTVSLILTILIAVVSPMITRSASASPLWWVGMLATVAGWGLVMLMSCVYYTLIYYDRLAIGASGGAPTEPLTPVPGEREAS